MIHHSCSVDLSSENKKEKTKRKKRKHHEKELALDYCDPNKLVVNGEEMM